VILSVLSCFVLFFALFFLASSIKTAKIRNNLNKTYNLTAKFNNINGISVGSDVKISGVKVGVIDDQFLDKSSYNAIIKFKINQDIKIPIDSSAKIASDGLLGGKYLSIEIGGDDQFLKENDQISFTQSSISFEDLLGKYLFNQKEESKK